MNTASNSTRAGGGTSIGSQVNDIQQCVIAASNLMRAARTVALSNLGDDAALDAVIGAAEAELEQALRLLSPTKAGA